MRLEEVFGAVETTISRCCTAPTKNKGINLDGNLPN